MLNFIILSIAGQETTDYIEVNGLGDFVTDDEDASGYVHNMHHHFKPEGTVVCFLQIFFFNLSFDDHQYSFIAFHSIANSYLYREI